MRKKDMPLVQKITFYEHIVSPAIPRRICSAERKIEMFTSVILQLSYSNAPACRSCCGILYVTYWQYCSHGGDDMRTGRTQHGGPSKYPHETGVVVRSCVVASTFTSQQADKFKFHGSSFLVASS